MTNSMQVDPKDPRYRYTFADVAMKIATDGPLYIVFIMIAVLALKGVITGENSVMALAIALLGRSKLPDDSKKPFTTLPNISLTTIAILVAISIASISLIVACT